MIAAIAKFLGIPDPRVLAAIALIWLGSLACLGAYMEGRATSLAETAKAEALADCSEAKTKAAEAARVAQAEAIRLARAEWDAAQAQVDALAKVDRDRIEAHLVAARVRADNLFRILQGHIHANPLPVDCRLDPERLRYFNAARRGDASASSDRPGL